MWPKQTRGDDGFVQLAGSVVLGAHKSVWSHEAMVSRHIVHYTMHGLKQANLKVARLEQIPGLCLV